MNRSWSTIALILALPGLSALLLGLVAWRYHARYGTPAVAQANPTDVQPRPAPPVVPAPVAETKTEEETPIPPPVKPEVAPPEPDPANVDAPAEKPNLPAFPVIRPINPPAQPKLIPDRPPPQPVPERPAPVAPPPPVVSPQPPNQFNPNMMGPPIFPPLLMPQTVLVPNVLNLRAGAARQALLAAGLNMQAGPNPSDASIFAQAPPFNAQVPPGTTVQVLFCVRVPDMVGSRMDYAQSLAALQSLGLNLRLTDTTRSIGPAINQNPKGLTEVQPNATILVTFQTRASTVPNVVGQGILQAQFALAQASLIPVFTDAASKLPADSPAKLARLGGVALSQSQAAGQPAKAGTPVTVTFSTIPVPNLVTGARFNRAAEIPQLVQFGLAVVIAPGSPTQAPGNKKLIIVGQNPPANSPLPFTAQAIQVQTQVVN